MSKNKSAFLEFTIPLIIGLAAGCIAGVLFAPGSGKTIRQKVAKNIKAAGDVIKEGVEIMVESADEPTEVSVDL